MELSTSQQTASPTRFKAKAPFFGQYHARRRLSCGDALDGKSPRCPSAAWSGNLNLLVQAAHRAGSAQRSGIPSLCRATDRAWSHGQLTTNMSPIVATRQTASWQASQGWNEFSKFWLGANRKANAFPNRQLVKGRGGQGSATKTGTSRPTQVLVM